MSCLLSGAAQLQKQANAKKGFSMGEASCEACLFLYPQGSPAPNYSSGELNGMKPNEWNVSCFWYFHVTP